MAFYTLMENEVLYTDGNKVCENQKCSDYNSFHLHTNVSSLTYKHTYIHTNIYI